MSIKNLTWKDEYSIGFTDEAGAFVIPNETIFALAQRGFNHIMGNEVAAYESGLKTATADDGKALRYSPTEIAVMVHDRRNEKLAEMRAGTLGYRAAGPRLSSDERMTRDIAKENLVTAFGKASAEVRAGMPKASAKDAWDDLVDRYLAVEKNAATVAKEMERRRKVAGSTAADDLGDLLASVKKAA